MKRDFADWINPILVKELRQGLRTRLFDISFIVLHTLLFLNLLVGVFAASKGRDSAVAQGFFWSTLTLLLLVVIPLRAFSAVSGEIKQNTLELVNLTRLSAWKIIFGKWFAIIAQASLFVIALLPYVVFRYFLGKVDVVLDLQALAVLLISSALVTAVLLGISSIRFVIFRGLFLVGAILFSLQFFIPLGIYFSVGFDLTFTSSEHGLQGLLIAALISGFLIGFCLLWAAFAIAPLAENLSVRKRLLGLVTVLLLLVVAALDWLPEVALIAASGIAALTAFDALCEVPLAPHIVAQRFGKKRGLRKIAHWFFVPGWPSGLLYTILLGGGLLVGGWFIISQLAWSGRNREFLIILGILIGGSLFPILFLNQFAARRHHQFRIVLYVAIQVGLLIFCIALRAIHGAAEVPLLGFFSFVPLAVPFALDAKLIEEGFALAILWASVFMEIIILFAQAWPHWRQIAASTKGSS